MKKRILISSLRKEAIKIKNNYLKYDKIFKSIIVNRYDTRYMNNLLSDILGRKVEVKEYLDLELKVKNKNERAKRLDVILKTKDDDIIIIELNSNYYASKKRNLNFLAAVYSQYTKAGEEYNESMRNVILINMNYNEGDQVPLKRTYYFTANEDGHLYGKFIGIVDINIDHYKRMWYDKNILGNKEHIFIVALGVTNEELQELGKQDKIIGKVGEKVLELNEDGQFVYTMTEEEEEAYFREDGIRELKKEVRKEGILEGKKEGKKEGMLAGIMKIAKNMLKKGFSVKEINEVTNLSVKEINKLQKEIKTVKK